MLVLAATGVESESQMPFAGLHQMLRPVMAKAIELISGGPPRRRLCA
jgi:hypothetical protein